MPKRSRLDIEGQSIHEPNKRRSRSPVIADETEDLPVVGRSMLRATPSSKAVQLEGATPSKVQFSTPIQINGSRSAQFDEQTAKNDHSARKKSATTLQINADQDEESDSDPTDSAIAQAILDDEDELDATATIEVQAESGAEQLLNGELPPEPTVPVKRPRGRPKGRKKDRTPTPPPDLPGHELYFFHNRTTASQTSTNVLPSHLVLNHEDYLAQIKAYEDPHAKDVQRLKQLHHRAFEQWEFELEANFSLCLYGVGSKRDLIMDLVDYLYQIDTERPIVIVNGYNSTISMKDILGTIAGLIFDPSTRLSGQPALLLEAIARQLSRRNARITLVIHNLDSATLRKAGAQSLLATLASLPQMALVASCDSLNFSLMWDLALLRQYNFIFHDATTFEPWSVEIDAPEEVNALLGRSSRSLTGKDGVGYVLKSLPENARNLFRILVAEQLALGDLDFDMGQVSDIEEDMDILGASDEEDMDILGASDEEEAVRQQETPSKRGRGRPKVRPAKTKPAPTVEGVEYRTLYHRAVEQFICSSEVNFRTLLKEFHDHQMIESRKDLAGTERLIVPFRSEELEAILEEL